MVQVICRALLVVAIVWLIQAEPRPGSVAAPIDVPSRDLLAHVRTLLPAVEELDDAHASLGRFVLRGADGTPLGYLITTSPQADSVVGFSGPTNTLLILDQEDRLVGATILSSRDTVDHVQDVRDDSRFLHELRGKTWEEMAAGVEVDAVSGATLTSLAIVEGITLRLGGTRPSLRFPEPISVGEIQDWFPEAATLEPSLRSPSLQDVRDAQENLLGAILRTSPAADAVIGYQGPTDAVVAFDRNGAVLGITLRKSFDNEPYVGYVRDDDYFRTLLRGQTLEQLAASDLERAGVEGVSGATMTSQAVAEGIFRAARAALAEPPRAPRRQIVFSARDAGTLAVLIAAIVICFSRLRGIRWVRISFQILLIGYFGFLNGDLLSQAQLAGWAENGVPWRLAPGLALLTAAALLIPPLTKRQLYCHHICPFGAAQQLVRLRVPWQLSLRPGWAKALAWIPGLLLLLVVVVVMRDWPVNLAAIEPFDAFFWRVAGVGTLVVAAVGLAASLVVPMAYCRFGCPTGALLGYVRRQGVSGRWSHRDAFALFLLAVAIFCRLW